MARDTDDGMQSQAREAQEATPGAEIARRRGGGRWRPLEELRSRFDAQPAPVRYAIYAVIVAVAALLPLWLPLITPQHNYWTNIATKIGVAVLLVLGLNVVVGFAGLLDLGYVAFFAVGAYSFALFTGAARYSVAIQGLEENAQSLKPEWQMWMWLLLFLAMGVALIAGVILGSPTLRLRGDYLAIVTLGFGEIIRVTANNLHSVVGGPRGVFNIPHPGIEIGPIQYDFGTENPPYYWLLLVIIVIWIFLLHRLNNSRVGRAWAAVREDELAAAAMGVPTVQYKLLAFAIGAAVASFGGVIYASQVSFISPEQFTLFNISFGSVTLLAMVVLGGMGGIAGPILGAAAIIFLPEYFRVIGDARFLVFGGALVVMMIVRPQGLIASRRRAAELKGEVREGSVFEVREHGGA